MANESIIEHSRKRIWKSIKGRSLNWYVDLHNGIFKGNGAAGTPSRLPDFEEIRRYTAKRTDINEHLAMLYAETIRMQPQLIVEIGVRNGESTYTFERAARLNEATLVSIDIEDCAHVSHASNWHFIHEDDITFAARFEEWCRIRKIDPQIDVLFIDTSHYYEHTRQEIKYWFPHLAERSIVFFHDTNMRNICRRRDGTLGRGWENDRGVIRALEDFFGKQFDETHDFIDVEPGWIIRHYAHNSGMTMLERVSNTTN